MSEVMGETNIPIVWCLIAIIVNMVVGAGVCSMLDTEDQVFYKWYAKDPFCGLGCAFVLMFWPLMAYLMTKNKRKNGEV